VSNGAYHKDYALIRPGRLERNPALSSDIFPGFPGGGRSHAESPGEERATAINAVLHFGATSSNAIEAKPTYGLKR